jgi:outer membrane protein OmpA-like peptidoglycan-associated protein
MIGNHVFFITSVGVVLAGCAAGPEPDASLIRARTEVTAAANNPDVVSSAALRLDAAQKALTQSESALKKGDMENVDHYAFLASRYAETAEQTARQKKAQQVVANAPAARNEALLQGARSETEKAKAEAAQARSTQGLVLTPRNILFKSGSAQLDDKAKDELRQIAQYLRANPGRKILIEGFTDSTGSAAINQQLSEQRADAVRLALAAEGVDASRIGIRGMGPADPIAGNADSSGRLINRRVAIIVSNADGSFPQTGH